jgi:hypothetical protein
MRGYSCDKTSTRRADRDVSHLIAKFLPLCDENQTMLPENCSQHQAVYIPNQNGFVFFHVQDYMSFQAPRQIFVDRSAWLGRPISRSVASDV